MKRLKAEHYAYVHIMPVLPTDSTIYIFVTLADLRVQVRPFHDP